MEKVIIITVVGKDKEIPADYYCGDERTNINEVIEFLLDAKQQGATHVEFDGDSEYESTSGLNSLTITTVTVVLESDDDFKTRELAEQEVKKQHFIKHENSEKELLKRLKQKYE
jgi:hypothetical protein